MFFSLTLLASLALIIKFRFKLEKSSYFVILSYFFTIGPRVFLILRELYPQIDIIIPICATITWATLLYFTFEMAFVKAMLKSETQKEYLKTKNYLSKTMIILFVIFFLIYLPLTILIFLKRNDK